MTSELTDDYWEERYRTGKIGWDRGRVHPALVDWLESGILQPGSILVPGCGNGYEVLYLAERGFDVTAVDFAPTPLESLRGQLDQAGSTANLVQADFLQWQTDQQFDVIYEQTCLCAVAPVDRSSYEKRVHQLLKPGGMLLLLLMQTAHPESGPPFHCDVSEMKSLFTPGRWDWHQEERVRYEHPSGTVHEFATRLTRR